MENPNLPTDILYNEILPRCTARCLLRFKCASKYFKTIISSPEFINLHLCYNLATNSDRFLVLKQASSGIHCLDINSSSDSPIFSLPIPPSLLRCGKGARIFGSCNGLLCIQRGPHFHGFSFVLLNPCNATLIDIPCFPIRTYQTYVTTVTYKPCDVHVGFGYDISKDDYKIVVILEFDDADDYYNSKFRDVMVYSVKAGCWRYVEDYIHIKESLIGIYNDGVLINNHLLHWFFCCPDDEKKYRIRCFDIQKENWVENVPLPDHINNFCTSRIGVLDGCLYLMKLENTDEFHREFADVGVWVMKEYGIKESWVKLLRFSAIDDGSRRFYHKFFPLTYSNNSSDEILIRRWNDIKREDCDDYTRIHEIAWVKVTDQQYDSGVTQTIRGVKNFESSIMCHGSLVTFPGSSQIMKENINDL